MKRILLSLTFVLTSFSLFAQQGSPLWSIIPRLGVSISSLTKGDDAVYYTDNTNILFPQYRLGFVGGVDVMVQPTTTYGVSIGVAYLQGGTKYKDMNLDREDIHDHYSRYDYLSFPILGHLYITKSLSINAGLAPAFMLKGKYHNEILTYDVDTEGKKQNFQELVSDQNTKPNLETFALSLPIGLSYEYENVVLDARYNIGLTKTSKNYTSHNKIFEISVGYKFTL